MCTTVALVARQKSSLSSGARVCHTAPKQQRRVTGPSLPACRLLGTIDVLPSEAVHVTKDAGQYQHVCDPAWRCTGQRWVVAGAKHQS
jgi:hypothetical protein